MTLNGNHRDSRLTAGTRSAIISFVFICCSIICCNGCCQKQAHAGPQWNTEAETECMLSPACPARSAHLDSVPTSSTPPLTLLLQERHYIVNSMKATVSHVEMSIGVCSPVCWVWGGAGRGGTVVVTECMQMVLMLRCVDEVQPRLDFLCPRAPSWNHQSLLVGQGYDCVCPRVCTIRVSLGVICFNFQVRLQVCLNYGLYYVLKFTLSCNNGGTDAWRNQICGWNFLYFSCLLISFIIAKDLIGIMFAFSADVSLHCVWTTFCNHNHSVNLSK